MLLCPAGWLASALEVSNEKVDISIKKLVLSLKQDFFYPITFLTYFIEHMYLYWLKNEPYMGLLKDALE